MVEEGRQARLETQHRWRVDAIVERGLEPDLRETYGNGVRHVTFRDPDGNEISFGGAPLDDA